ncbi:hypothetical protein BBI01_18015 [Chryseobacterium artocarpi]|uniref:Methylamine utilisation protein MauE domain-containing protein n=2 Tax=Chryseobacterium artocarpi TaxID=1414727 RepID=A0A1B8ZC60_9FLAO|nr:hypothetical protein BBI01_18015 [Chryseobacterium artocarpi]
MPTITAYFFILLFCYASVSKLLDFENFQVQIAQSPLLSAYAGYISYAVIIAELFFALLLVIPYSRLLGLYCSLAIMISFTIYIYLILNFSDFIPCSCGGILEKLGWTEHLFFNLGCILLALTSILLVEYDKMKKILHYSLNIVAISIASTSVVVYLFYSSEYTIKNENNFTRRYFPNALFEDNRVSLDHQFYYFAGNNSDSIFLGDITSPLQIKIIGSDLRKVENLKVGLDSYDYSFKRLRLTVKDNYYYFSDGSVPIIYMGRFNQSSAKTVSYRQVYFNQFIPIDSTRFVFRTISAKTKSFTLGIQKYDSREKAVMHPEIITKQADGIFDSDGNLISSRQNAYLIYTYIYRNQFILMDENLNILSTQNTIDTTSVAKIQTKTLADGRTKMNAPPFKVNKLQASVNKLLLNQSDLIGKNESEKRWKSSWAIDIYNFEKKQYIASFYIPHNKGEKLTGLLATKDRIYVLTSSELISYRYRNNLSSIINK